MNILNRLLRKLSSQVGRPGNLIEVPNPWGVGDGTPLVVEQHPDLESIFSNPNPQPPQQLTEENRSYWASQDQRSIRIDLAMAYMSHPDPQVRASTIGQAKDIGGLGIAQMLVDLLVDPSSVVSTTAAKAIWAKERSVNCKYAVEKLKDELEGFVTLGPTKARQALDLLVQYAPDEKAREGIMKLINT